jgi:hypothetical protein
MDYAETFDRAFGSALGASTPSANRSELPAALPLLPRTPPTELPHERSGPDGFTGIRSVLPRRAPRHLAHMPK